MELNQDIKAEGSRGASLIEISAATNIISRQPINSSAIESARDGGEVRFKAGGCVGG